MYREGVVAIAKSSPALHFSLGHKHSWHIKATARVVRAGTVDDAKVEIGALLEGGPEAFRERARRYGGKYESRS